MSSRVRSNPSRPGMACDHLPFLFHAVQLKEVVFTNADALPVTGRSKLTLTEHRGQLEKQGTNFLHFGEDSQIVLSPLLHLFHVRIVFIKESLLFSVENVPVIELELATALDDNFTLQVPHCGRFRSECTQLPLTFLFLSAELFNGENIVDTKLVYHNLRHFLLVLHVAVVLDGDNDGRVLLVTIAPEYAYLCNHVEEGNIRSHREPVSDDRAILAIVAVDLHASDASLQVLEVSLSSRVALQLVACQVGIV